MPQNISQGLGTVSLRSPAQSTILRSPILCHAPRMRIQAACNLYRVLFNRFVSTSAYIPNHSRRRIDSRASSNDSTVS